MTKPTFSPSHYQAPNPHIWQGRTTKPALGKPYWYQQLRCVELDALTADQIATDEPTIALLGYACDEGVRRNQGRVGAKDGPQAMRQQLAKLAWHHSLSALDVGTILCEDGNLERCQDTLAASVEQLLKANLFPMVLGGGHDVAYGHFKGIWHHLNQANQPKVGIINLDAHFDLRPVDPNPNSGTPFYQILREHGEQVSYMVLGIQQEANTHDLFDVATQYDVKVITNWACSPDQLSGLYPDLDAFMAQQDAIYLTIDLDGFAAAYAPGVSATSPLGFSPQFVWPLLKHIFASKKVVSCDIAELNPRYDQDQITAKLGSRLVDHIVSLID